MEEKEKRLGGLLWVRVKREEGGIEVRKGRE